MDTIPKVKLKGTKRLFMKLGSCSRTTAFILNREFDNMTEPHERALDPLAGGIVQEGYQCGMLWGSALGVGAEAQKRTPDPGKATALAILATQHVMVSFVKKAKSTDCGEITHCNWQNKWSIARHFVTGNVFSCFRLMEKWAPEAVREAYKGLERDPSELPAKCRSCASEVAKRMGGTKEEAIMVAGFAGGIGLSGNACGALGAAIWMKTLALYKANPEKSFFYPPEAKKLMNDLLRHSGDKILCREITGKEFRTLEEHTEFIEKGGCRELMDSLVA